MKRCPLLLLVLGVVVRPSRCGGLPEAAARGGRARPGAARRGSTPWSSGRSPTKRSRGRSCSSAGTGRSPSRRRSATGRVEPSRRADDARHGLRHGLAHQAGRDGDLGHDPVEQGKLRLDDRLGQLLPEFDNHGKGAITVEQLLRHRAGPDRRQPDRRLRRRPGRRPGSSSPSSSSRSPPGERSVYSDVGFMILGRLVEKVSGEPLDEFAHENIFEPLGMSRHRLPPRRNGAATLEPDRADRAGRRRDAPGRGPRPAVPGPGRRRGPRGAVQHGRRPGGLRPDAPDGGIGPNGRRVLAPLTVRRDDRPGATRRRTSSAGSAGTSTRPTAPRGARCSAATSFGHTGFTGTSLWVDPETETFVILLTSRLHPDGKAPSPTALRHEVATIVAAADRRRAGRRRRRRPASICGIDVLARDGFAPLQGKRVGLVTNHTGRTRDGRLDDRRPVQGARRQARRPLQPRARHPRRWSTPRSPTARTRRPACRSSASTARPGSRRRRA